jgi:hypothetical protein
MNLVMDFILFAEETAKLFLNKIVITRGTAFCQNGAVSFLRGRDRMFKNYLLIDGSVRFTKFYYGGEIKDNEMDGSCNTHGTDEKCIQSWVGEHEGKRPLGRPKRKWEDNIRIHVRETGCKIVDWIDLTQDRDQWRTELGSEPSGSIKDLE